MRIASRRNRAESGSALTVRTLGIWGGGKSNAPPEEWFADEDAAYLERHLILAESALWKLDRFEDFVAECE